MTKTALFTCFVRLNRFWFLVLGNVNKDRKLTKLGIVKCNKSISLNNKLVSKYIDNKSITSCFTFYSHFSVSLLNLSKAFCYISLYTSAYCAS